MATRSDISVFWNLSPRLIVIASPSTEVTIQDLHDTLRDIEDEPNALQYPSIIESAGKEPLGGGVTVGLTSTLQNAQVMFERRAIAASTGTVTTASDPGVLVTLTDSAADFVTDGIEPGYIVVNTVDESHAEVVEVTDAQNLLILSPTGGAENDYDVGEDYIIYPNIECSIAGGNLVAVDENGDPISPVFPSFGTYLVRTSSSSATLQELADIQYASFNGGITVDITSPYSGTNYPNGTPRQPVNNIADAVAMATERGFTTLFIIGDITLDDAVPSLNGFSFVGESANKTTIQIDSNADVENSEFLTATINGVLDGGNVVSECVINTLNFVDGFITQCVLNGTITLSTLDDAHFLDCWSGVPGLSTPTIDFGGAGSGLAMRNYNGGITLKNKTGSESVSLDLNSGQIILEDTVTTGTIVLRGIGTWTNEVTYAGGADIVNQMISPNDLQATAFGKAVTIDTTSPYSGTTYPTGTARMPVNNLADAKSIAVDQGFSTLSIVGNITFSSGDDISNYTISGQSASLSTVVLGTGVVADNSQFEACTLTGDLSAGHNVLIRSSVAMNIINFDGIIHQTMLKSAISIDGDAVLLSCYSGGTAVDSAPIINFNNNPVNLIVRDFSGALKLANKTQPEECSIDTQGSIYIYDTVTSGTIILRGVGSWLNKDAYIGGATIVNELTSDVLPTATVNEINAQIYDGEEFGDIMADLLAMAKGKIVESPAGTFTFYEQDDTTPRFVLVKSGNERVRV